MSIFRCDKCGCMENTALCNYWNKGDGPALCSECESGKWHGIFPKESAVGSFLGNDGFLYHKDEIGSDKLKWREEHQGFKIIKEIKDETSKDQNVETDEDKTEEQERR